MVTPDRTSPEVVAERLSEQAIGLGPVTHHDPVGPTPLGYQPGRRRMGLAADLRLCAARDLDRRDQRPCTRQQPPRGGERAVVVGGQQSGTRSDGQRCQLQAFVVERWIHADHNCVGVGIGHQLGAGPSTCLGHTRPADHQHPLAGLHASRRGHRRGDHCATRVDSMARQLRFLILDGMARHVRHEQHVVTRVAQSGYRVGYALDGCVLEPDDAVEVQDPRRHGVVDQVTSQVG